MTIAKRAGAVLALFAALACEAPAQAADGPLRIGVLTDISGAYSAGSGTGSVTAAQMAVEDFGKTVLGRPIEVLSADHQNKPEVGLSQARRWFDLDGVGVVVDVPGSAIALGVQSLAQEKDKILLVAGAGSTELTGARCSPNSVVWAYNSYALAQTAVRGLMGQGDDSWFFVTVDYTFGRDLEQQAAKVVTELGGKVVGSVKHPLGASDFSSPLLTAQASSAKVVALANAGTDAENAIKQFGEFGLAASGKKVIALLFTATGIGSMGLPAAQGLTYADGFYAGRNAESQAWAKRFQQRVGTVPTMTHAGVYSAVLHYLRAVEKSGSAETARVMEGMRAMPVRDAFTDNGVVRADGQMVHDMYLLEAKKPAESAGSWDLTKLVRVVPAAEAFQAPTAFGCPLTANR